MKKSTIIIIILLVLVLIGFSLAGYFYFNYLKPAIGPSDIKITPEGDIITDKGQAEKETSDEPDLPLLYPSDFRAGVYAGGLGKVRDIMEAPRGIIVTSMAAGKVIYLPDKDTDNKADEQSVLLEGRYNPHGMAEYCAEENCIFYLAETDAVYRFDYDKDKMTLINEEKILDLPDDGGHYTRHVLVAEIEGEPKLLTTVGSECNVCEEADWRRAKILISNLDGSELKEYAKGLRNSVFMALSPFTGEVYATDMGRDWLGDDLPPEEVNIIKEGEDYGWPVCYGNKVHDTEFDKNTYVRNPCEDTVAPHITMPAHSAPLGLSFIPEEGFGEDYWHDLLVVQHGSWNRSTPIGYQVVRMELDRDGNYSGTQEFLTGFLEEGEAWGRPADVLALPGGMIFISDDKAGAVYWMEYKN